MEAVTFENLSFTYPEQSRPALKQINISIGISEFVLICGKSGCGKSTLLKHMKKNRVPYGVREGRALYCGVDLLEMDSRQSVKEIGFVGQNPENQIVTDKVWHELVFGLENLGYGKKVIEKRVAETASYFGIQNWYHKDTAELSGGQKQLLNLAAVMAMHPKLLLLDEPTSQLDPVAAVQFLETLRKINEDTGTGIILSEHRLEEIFPMVGRVIVLEDGKVILDDNPKMAGRALSKTESGIKEGLPAAMKLYGAFQGEGECPLSVREGRIWLEKRIRPYVQKENTKVTDNKCRSQREKETVLQLKNLWYRYEKKGPDILQGIDLELLKGECFCLTGGNGSGKSTLFKVLIGETRAWRGKSRINGKVCMVPQNPKAVFTEITVLEELEDMFVAEGEENRRKVQDVLSYLELEGCEETHPYDLSGGEQQKLALGKVLLLEPDILLLDEPTKGLDAEFKRKLIILLKYLCKERGKTILINSHDIEFCAETAGHCGILFDGRIVAAGTPEEIFGGNRYYTTAVNRIVQDYFPEAVTWEEAVRQCKETVGSSRKGEGFGTAI